MSSNPVPQHHNFDSFNPFLLQQLQKEEAAHGGNNSWVLLWSDIFTFSSKSRDPRSIKKMMVFIAKKLLLECEIAS